MDSDRDHKRKTSKTKAGLRPALDTNLTSITPRISQARSHKWTSSILHKNKLWDPKRKLVPSARWVKLCTWKRELEGSSSKTVPSSSGPRPKASKTSLLRSGETSLWMVQAKLLLSRLWMVRQRQRHFSHLKGRIKSNPACLHLHPKTS